MKDTIKIEFKSNAESLAKGLKAIADSVQDKKKMFRILSRTVMGYIEENFETQGENSGKKWDNWSGYYRQVREKLGKAGGKILTLDAQLRQSIDRKITDSYAEIGTNKEYAAIHNFGYDGTIKRKTKSGSTSYHLKMPKRTFMEFTDNLENLVEQRVWDYAFEKYTKINEKEIIDKLNG